MLFNPDMIVEDIVRELQNENIFFREVDQAWKDIMESVKKV